MTELNNNKLKILKNVRKINKQFFLKKISYC